MEDATHKVARQYTDYAYPAPADDLDALMATGYFDLTDPSLFGPNLWPEGRSRQGLDILVAGCGAQQAAVIAYKNPGCRVLGVDLSATSLGHEAYLRERHGLSDLQLVQGDLRNVAELGRSFDLVVSSGVLHHMTDPSEGLNALRGVLKPDGAMVLMVYAAFGRIGVYPLQDAFRRMGLGQNPEGIAAVRAALAGLPPTHPVQTYLKTVEELVHDTAVVDTFLHPQDRAYTVPEVLEWVSDCGLEFQNWAQNFHYYPQAMIGEPTLSRISALPAPDQWAAVDALLTLTGRHTFVARHPGRAVRPDFSGAAWLGYRPSFMHYARVLARGGETGVLQLYNLNLPVTPAEVEALRGADGQTTIGAILERPAFGGSDRPALEAFGRALFERLWKTGALMIELG